MQRVASHRICISAAIAALALAALPASPALAWEKIADPAEGPFALGGELSVTSPGNVSFEISFGGSKADQSGDHYLLTSKSGSVQFYKVTKGKAAPLGAAGELPALTADSTVNFALHRDPWRMAFILGNRVVARAYDASLTGPVVAYQADSGVAFNDAWLQPVGDIMADDRFERTEKEDAEQGDWDKLSGSWSLISLREDRQAGQMQADKTTNAFSYYATADGKALATHGNWFWRNCQFALAGRSNGTDGAFGIAFYTQDADNYLLFKWDNRFTPRPGGPYISLLAVVDGKEQLLARKPGGYLPEQWYQLQVNVCDENIFCSIDGKLQLEASTPLFGEGGVGLYAEGKQGTWFDDLHVKGWTNLVETFETEEPGKWITGAGKWDLSGGAAVASANGMNLLTSGDTDWSEYAVTAQAKGTAAAFGIAVASDGPKDSYLFRWAPEDSKAPFAGKAQIVYLGQDGDRVLAEAPLPEGLPSAVGATVVVDSDYIAGLLDGKRVVDSAIGEALHGKVGLYALDAKAATFDDLRVDPLPPPKMARITKEFTDEKTHFEMVEWASTRHNWIKPDEKASPQVWRTKGDYYGPLRVKFDLKDLGTTDGTLRLALEPDDGSGEIYAVTITAAKGAKNLTVKLLFGDKELAQASYAAPEATCPVSVERRGEYLLVSLNGQMVIEHKLAG